jgi:hypothetical protein
MTAAASVLLSPLLLFAFREFLLLRGFQRLFPGLFLRVLGFGHSPSYSRAESEATLNAAAGVAAAIPAGVAARA